MTITVTSVWLKESIHSNFHARAGFDSRNPREVVLANRILSIPTLPYPPHPTPPHPSIFFWDNQRGLSGGQREVVGGLMIRRGSCNIAPWFTNTSLSFSIWPDAWNLYNLFSTTEMSLVYFWWFLVIRRHRVNACPCNFIELIQEGINMSVKDINLWRYDNIDHRYITSDFCVWVVGPGRLFTLREMMLLFFFGCSFLFIFILLRQRGQKIAVHNHIYIF